MPASNDPASVKEGGLAQKTLGTEKCQIIEFPDMKHGWSVRGDCSKPLVRYTSNPQTESSLKV